MIKMNYYLSSYRFGDSTDELKKLIPENNKIGYILNAGDGIGNDLEKVNHRVQEEMDFLDELGFHSELLDLKDYFGKKESLKIKLDGLGGLWICGGNTFVLRQAMKLSGFDELFETLQARNDFLYSGYSAGICILSTNLRPIDRVDEPFSFPYEGIDEPIYEGLGLFEHILLPHYDSDHHESADIEKEVQRCIENQWPFKTLRDGEVIIKNR
jgi:dipeptidase E